MDKVREQFESAYLEMIAKEFSEGLVPRMRRTLEQRRSDLSYQDPTQRWMFWAWAASREAVVIELPCGYDPYRANGDPDMLNVNDTLQECREAIEAQGFKVAP